MLTTIQKHFFFSVFVCGSEQTYGTTSHPWLSNSMWFFSYTLQEIQRQERTGVAALCAAWQNFQFTKKKQQQTHIHLFILHTWLGTRMLQVLVPKGLQSRDRVKKILPQQRVWWSHGRHITPGSMQNDEDDDVLFSQLRCSFYRTVQKDL